LRAWRGICRTGSQSARLTKPDDVAVCVSHGGNQPAAADIFDGLLRIRTGVQEFLQSLLYVVDVPVADRPRHSLVVAVGVQAYLLTANFEPNVIRRVVRSPVPRRALKSFLAPSISLTGKKLF
jgi:hypothetical protein